MPLTDGLLGDPVNGSSAGHLPRAFRKLFETARVEGHAPAEWISERKPTRTSRHFIRCVPTN